MTMAVPIQPEGLLRSPGFDFTFVVGIASVAVATGFVVTANPDWFWPIVIADLWLLGYHHVIATYTRLVFDKKSFAEHRWLVLYLPALVAGTVTLIALATGLWGLATIYLYWQWFHYTRQSEGISKAYGGRARDRDLGDLRVSRIAFYAVPLAGILHVSARDPGTFLNMPIRTLSVPDWLLSGADIIAATAFFAWLGYQLRALLQGRMAVPYFCYVMSHFTVFFVAYIWLTEINYGWLTVNIWHNAQYILFVWLFNNRRFRGAVDPERVFLSTISQNGRFLLYTGVCLAISSVVYFFISAVGVDALSTAIGVSAGIAAIIIYQTLNFHHYIVDSLIWKLRQKSMRGKLGLT